MSGIVALGAQRGVQGLGTGHAAALTAMTRQQAASLTLFAQKEMLHGGAGALARGGDSHTRERASAAVQHFFLRKER